MKESGDQVGEAFTYPGAGFEEQGCVCSKRVGNRLGHICLLRSMFQSKSAFKMAARLKNSVYELAEIARLCGSACLFCQSDHGPLRFMVNVGSVLWHKRLVLKRVKLLFPVLYHRVSFESGK